MTNSDGITTLPELVLDLECHFHIAQEALNNALKHARAQSVRILLDFPGSETRLEVSDDGCGFEPEAADRSGGLGLRGMRERPALNP